MMKAKQAEIDRQFERAEKDATRAAKRISRELKSLMRRLGPWVAPETAYTTVLWHLIIHEVGTVELLERAWSGLQPWKEEREARERRESSPNLN